MRFLPLALSVASVSAGSWGVQGGTPGRLLTNSAVKSAASEASASESSADPAPHPRAPGRMSFPLITPPTPTFVASAQFTMASNFHFQKTPGAVVTSKGDVAFVSDECYLVVLPNPDSATAASFWTSPIYLDMSAVSVTAHSDCGDLVLDESDHAYTISCDYNTLACFVFGWDLSNPSQVSQLSWSPSTVTGLAFPRILEEYTAGLLYSSGKIFWPISYTLSFGAGGVAVIDTATGKNTVQKVGPAGMNVAVTGSALLSSGDVVGMLTYTNGRFAGPSMASLDANTGAVKWTSQAITRQDIDHPHPLVDPYTGNVYAMTFQNLAPSPAIQLLCVAPTTGQPCSGYPINGSAFVDDFDNFTAQWYYGAAALPNADSTALAGLVFAIDTSIGPDPISGCLIIVNPSTRAITQSVCYSRNSIVAVQHFATAPIVGVDARGPGLHTILIAEFDFTVSAFDPANLAAGPLYRINPLLPGTKGTVSCDYMSMTAGGSLLLVGWRDDTTQYTAIAIPGALRAPPSSGSSSSNKKDELSPGAAAGVAVGVIAAVAIAATAGLYFTGRLPAVLGAIGSIGSVCKFSKSSAKSGGGLLPTKSSPYGGYTSGSSF